MKKLHLFIISFLLVVLNSSCSYFVYKKDTKFISSEEGVEISYKNKSDSFEKLNSATQKARITWNGALIVKQEKEGYHTRTDLITPVDFNKLKYLDFGASALMIVSGIRNISRGAKIGNRTDGWEDYVEPGYSSDGSERIVLGAAKILTAMPQLQNRCECLEMKLSFLP